MGSIAERGICLVLASTFLVPANLVFAQDVAKKAPQDSPRVEASIEALDGLDEIDVDPRTGGVLFQRADLSVGEAELSYAIRRTYRPYGGDQANLGHNWATNLDVHLDVHPKKLRASFQDEEGRRYFFARNAKTKQLEAMSGRRATLKELKDGYTISDLGDGRVYRFDAQGWLTDREGPSSLRIKYRYDKAKRLRAIVGPWGTIEVKRDAKGRLSELIAPGERSVRYRYDADNNLVRVVRSAEYERYGYDSAGRLSRLGGDKASLAYDAAGRVIHLGGVAVRRLKVRYLQGKGEWAQTTVLTRGELEETFDYSSDERRVRHTDPEGRTTLSEFDARERLVRFVGSDGQGFKQTYDDQGRLLTRVTPRGTQRYTYGSKFSPKPTRVSYPDGRVISFKYDLRGNVLETTAPGGAKATFEYDGASRLIKMVDRRGATTTFARDAQGFVLEINEEGVGKTSFLRNEAGRLLKVKRPDGRVVKVKQGAGGRTFEVSDALGVVQSVSFDARRRVTRLLDEHGNDYRYSYGAFGELLAVTNHGQHLIAYRYDASGRVQGIVDANGNQTSIRHTAQRTVEVEDPAGGKRTVVRDAGNRIVSETRGATTIRYRYDDFGQLIERVTPRGSERFSYDQHGRMTSLRGPDGGYGLAYDKIGRLSAMTNLALKQSVQYEYNAVGDRTAMHMPWGKVAYKRDLQGRLTGVSTPKGEKIKIDVHPDGRRKAIRYPNGVTSRFVYEKSRLKAVVTAKGEQELDRRVYGYDEHGRVAWSEDSRKERTVYGYDAQGRLTSVAGPDGKVSYRYDAAGNRVATTRDGATIKSEIGPGNRVLTQGKVRYTYTATGAVETKTDDAGTTRYVYDHDDRLVEVIDPKGDKVAYGYAPNGTRLWREAGGKKQHFLHDLADVVGELSADGKPVTSYVHGDGNDDVLAASRGADSFFYHYDRVRSVTSMTGADGALAATYRYDAFGKANEVTGKAASWNPYRFTSRTFDQQADLHHYRARHYSSELGRFTSPDPAGVAGGANLYVYVNNDPMRFNDPSGLWPDWLDRRVEATTAWVNRNVVEPVASAAKWTHENVLKPVADATVYAARQTYFFGKGFVKGVANVAVGLYQFVRHPIQTVTAIYKAIENWDETKEALKAKWEEYKDAAMNDPEKFAEMTGTLTAEILLAVVSPTKGLTAVSGLAKTAAVANNLNRVSRVARVATTPVVRNAARAGNSLARTFPKAANVVRNGRVLNRARNMELARRGAETTSLLRRVPRRVGYVARDVYNGGRLAMTRPGAYAVYTGMRSGHVVRGLALSTGRGLWKATKYGTIPATLIFKDNITDALAAYENREEALKALSDKAKAFVSGAGSRDAAETAAKIEEIGGVYGTYRDALMKPVHDEDMRLDAALKELDRKVAAGEIPDNTIDSRLNALLEEFGRRRHNAMVEIYDRSREEPHDMYSPSINRTISYQDEIDLLTEARGRTNDATSTALYDARIADLTARMEYEYDLFRRGDHDVLIAGIAGVPRDENDTPAGSTPGNPDDTEFNPGMLDTLEGALSLPGD